MTPHVALVSEHANPLAPLGTADAGGQNVYVDALARHLARHGALVDVFTRRDDPGPPDIVEAAPGVWVHHVRAGPAEPIPKDELFGLMPEFSQRLKEVWRWRRPDVVHAHFWMSGWAALAARPARVPLIQTFHALGVVKRRHQGAADTSPPERAAVERGLLTDTDAVVATCRDEVDELVALGAARQRITVIPCGVDGDFHPAGRRLPRPDRQRKRVVCVSRLVPRKGIGNVIEAMSLLPDDVELIVAGGPPLAHLDDDSEVRRLRALADRLGVAGRCHLVGSLGRADVAALLRSADVAACTPWYEPFGIVPVEAMACGVPVVGTDVGGLRDTIADGVTGILVPPRRPDAIATAIHGLLTDPARRRALGSAAARRADRLYRWSTIARSVLDVYDAALGHGAARRKVVTA
jgi:glycosyltransferase involved in cell wall biosynthesis